jgi:hypothetical protein
MVIDLPAWRRVGADPFANDVDIVDVVEVVDNDDNDEIAGIELDGDSSGIIDEERSCW